MTHAEIQSSYRMAQSTLKLHSDGPCCIIADALHAHAELVPKLIPVQLESSVCGYC